MHVRSRIKQFFSDELIFELDKIRRDRLIDNNNDKVDKVIKVLQKHNLDYNSLGPGTNRFAILVDNYVVKIALDDDGVNDNNQEFMLSEELQPFVIKVYETNGLLLVTEYVTLIDREEFKNSTDELRQILSMITENYLIGDVGTVLKNYLNWGYRDNGELVILDFAYFFPATQELMRCKALINPETGQTCEGILDYDANFHDLVCPVCGKKQMTGRIRARIAQEEREQMIRIAEQSCYKVTDALTVVPDREYSDEDDFEEEDDNPFKEWDLSGLYEEESRMTNYDDHILAVDEDDVANSAYDAMLNALLTGDNPKDAITDAVSETYREVYPQAFQEAVIGVRDEDISEIERYSLEPVDEIELDPDEEEANAAYDAILNSLKSGGRFTIETIEKEVPQVVMEPEEEEEVVVEVEPQENELEEEPKSKYEVAENIESTLERIEDKVDEIKEEMSTIEKVEEPCDCKQEEPSMVEESPVVEPEIEVTQEEVTMDDDSNNESMGESKDEIEEESSAQNKDGVSVSYASQIEEMMESQRENMEPGSSYYNPESEEDIANIRAMLSEEDSDIQEYDELSDEAFEELVRKTANVVPNEGADVDVSKSKLTRL